MKSSTAVIVFFIILIIGAFAFYQTIVTINLNRQRQNHEKLCALMTDELNLKINEDSEYTEYYCYYMPYAPPEGYENTQTMCVCDGKLHNGETVSIQVLMPR